jgi:bifunctional oligoribonuclease and PAP phosphatase NrnA
MNEILFRKVNNLINESNRILLIAHANPDGDAIASVCAMAEYLKNIGKSYQAYCHDQPPSQFEFISCYREFSYKIRENKAENTGLIFDFSTFDLIMVFDCGSLERTMLKAEISARRPDQKVVEFDHHPKVYDYADLEIRDHRSSSTAEIVYDFFKANNIKLNMKMAKAILTGISTDTGNFLYPSTSDKTIKIASEMLLYGANLPKIVENTWRNKSINAMKFWGKVMSGLKVNRKYSIAVAALPLSEMEGMEIDNEELEGLSNFLGNLSGVKAIIFIRQTGPGQVKGSIRTSDEFTDVSKLAKVLGGGGHPKASGFTLEGELVETEKGWKVI